MQSLRFRWPLAILVFAVLTSICTARAAEPRWPGWRGPNRDGKSPDTGLLKTWPADGPKQLWKVTGIGQGFSSVSFGGGLLYTTGRKEAGDPAKVPQAEHVFKRTGDRLYLKALDMEGKVKWSKDVGEAYVRSYKGSRATPTYDDGYLYLEGGIGMVGCYDAQTGKEKWTRKFSEFEGKVGGYGWGYSESVLIVGDLAVVSPGGKCFMVALNKSTGETVWQSEGFGPAQYSSPIHVVYQDVPMIINGSHQGLIAVHAKTGKTLWTQEFAKDNVASVPTPAFADGYVFWAAGYGKGGICLKLSASGGQVTATEAWRTADMDCHHGGYVIVDGYIYGSHREEWTCLELKSGNKKWEAKGVGKGSMCWADGMLYLFGEKDGKAALATCSPNGLELKGALQVSGEGPSWAHPVVAGGRLYLRYDDNLYCFDVAGGGGPAGTASGNADREHRLFNVSQLPR